ncbi:MAG: DMT family transporter [Intestinibacillus sp.]
MKSTKRIYLLLVLTTAAWGSLYVANKFVLGYLPTFTILFVRYLVAAVSMTVILRARKAENMEKPVKIAPQDRKYVALLGLGGYVASVTFQQVGTRIAGASPASLINSMNPIFIVLFAVLLLHEKLTFKKVVCVISAVTGAACIVGGGVAGSHVAGVLFSLLSVLVWSFVSVTVRRVTQCYDPLTLTTYGIYIAALFTLPLCVWEFATTPDLALLQPKLLLPLIYLGTVCTAGAHTLWNYCLSRLEASTCALFYPIQPLTSMTLGILLLHEKITGAFLLGAVLILGGVLYSSLGGAKQETA